MTTLIYKVSVRDIASELSTRTMAELARQKLISILKEFEGVEVDFDFISLTPSFADECIGRLAAEIGLVELKKRVKLFNVHESSKPLVKHVILRRCSQRLSE
jgi:hypothetical protein